MFDVKHGAELADTVYEQVMMREDVSLWYEYDYYDKNLCWERASHDVLLLDVGDDDFTDLMAWTIEQQRRIDDCDTLFTAWNDGFGYLFGSTLASKYEEENL